MIPEEEAAKLPMITDGQWQFIRVGIMEFCRRAEECAKYDRHDRRRARIAKKARLAKIERNPRARRKRRKK